MNQRTFRKRSRHIHSQDFLYLDSGCQALEWVTCIWHCV